MRSGCLGALGGYGLPCIGPLRRVLVPRALGNLCPSAERTPPHYKALVTLFRELTAMDPDLDPREVAPARLCEQLVSARGTLRSPPPTFPWLELTSGKVPKEVADLQWQRGSPLCYTSACAARRRSRNSTCYRLHHRSSSTSSPPLLPIIQCRLHKTKIPVAPFILAAVVVAEFATHLRNVSCIRRSL
ncbi:hypothetical protein MTO96_029700 [Rhipicephalus appendiculatus]